MKRPTTGSDGRWNGYLIEIWSVLQRPDLQPSQVYLTAVAPHSRKGPHLHRKRRGLFFCVEGSVTIRWRDEGGIYWFALSGEIADFAAPIEIQPGCPSALYNDGDETALVLNMPSPAWSKEDPDDWPVEDWNDVDCRLWLPKAA